MKDLSKIKKIQILVFSLFILLVLIFGYNNMILKRLDVSLVLAISTLTLFIIALAISRKKESLLIKLGLKIQFGKGKRFTYLFIFNISLGLLFIISGVLYLPDFIQMIFKATIGIGWVLIGIGNRPQYYIEIGEKYITKLKFDSIKLEKIESVEYMNDKLIIKKGNKIMEIFLNEFTPTEKEVLIEKLKKRFIINNLA